MRKNENDRERDKEGEVWKGFNLNIPTRDDRRQGKKASLEVYDIDTRKGRRIGFTTYFSRENLREELQKLRANVGAMISEKRKKD